MPRMGNTVVHTHASDAQGGQLDIDNALSDVVHTHESAGEGGQVSHDAALSGVSADDHHKRMAPQVDDLGATTWGIPGWNIAAVAASAPAAEWLLYVPIYVERSRTFTQIGVHVTVAAGAGSVGRLGIYAAKFDAAGDLTPDTLTLDAGTVAVDSTGEKSITISQTLAEGWHFLAFSSDGGPTLVRPDSAQAVTVPTTSRAASINTSPFTSSYVVIADGAAALPDPATAPTTGVGILGAVVWLGE